MSNNTRYSYPTSSSSNSYGEGEKDISLLKKAKETLDSKEFINEFYDKLPKEIEDWVGKSDLSDLKDFRNVVIDIIFYLVEREINFSNKNSILEDSKAELLKRIQAMKNDTTEYFFNNFGSVFLEYLKSITSQYVLEKLNLPDEKDEQKSKASKYTKQGFDRLISVVKEEQSKDKKLINQYFDKVNSVLQEELPEKSPLLSDKTTEITLQKISVTDTTPSVVPSASNPQLFSFGEESPHFRSFLGLIIEVLKYLGFTSGMEQALGKPIEEIFGIHPQKEKDKKKPGSYAYKQDLPITFPCKDIEGKVMNTQNQTVSLYDDEKDAYVEYTEDDLFGLVTGDKKILEKFGYSECDENYLNKGLFTSMLSQFKNEKSKKYLCDILFWRFPEKSNYFSAVDTAAWQILLKYSITNRDWVINVFKEVFSKGNYAAKLSCTVYAATIVEEGFLELLNSLAENGEDERIRKTALREASSLKGFLKNGIKTQDLLSPQIPKLSPG